MIARDLSFGEFKEFLAYPGVKLSFIELTRKYHLYAFDGTFGFQCRINKTDPANADQTDFEDNFKNLSTTNLAQVPKDERGTQYVTPGLRRASPGFTDWTFITHDFGDRKTWYQYSERVLNETLTTSDNLTYSATNAHWIDPYSQRLTANRRRLLNKDGSLSDRRDYAPIIKVGGVESSSGFTIDHTSGQVTFDASQAGATITADYSHNDGISGRSRFNLMPQSTKVITIEHVELQFSKSTIFNPLLFEIWGGGTLEDYGDFSQAIFDAGYGQLKTEYRGIRDIINFCNQGQGEIPAMDGLTSPVVVFPFNYLYAQTLTGSQGVLFSMLIENDQELANCEMGTITFYTEMTV